jgi:ferritin-like protein
MNDKEQLPAIDSDQHPKSARRDLLGSSAAVVASALLGGLAVACSDDGDGDDLPRPPSGDAGIDGSSNIDAGVDAALANDATAGVDADIAPLNALLRAEYGAITAYTAGAGLLEGAAETDPLYALRLVIRDIAVDFQSHHKLHAAALVEAIQQLGGTPVVESEVAATFAPPAALLANKSIMNVLKFAAGAERSAAVAYNKVVSSLEAARLRYLGAAIGGDESQHFIVLTALVLGLAAPGPNLSSDRADDVVPQPFVRSIGSADSQAGLEKAPPNYFS